MNASTHGVMCLHIDGQKRGWLSVLLTISGCREWQLFHVKKKFQTALRLMDAKWGQRKL